MHGDPASIEWLGRVSGGIASVGGKAFALDMLARNGFAVPPGFCIKSSAFKEHVSRVRTQLAGEFGSKCGVVPAMVVRQPLAPDLDREIGLWCAALALKAQQRGNKEAIF